MSTCSCDCRSLQRPEEGQDPLELEFQAVVSCPVLGIAAQPQSSARAAHTLCNLHVIHLKEEKVMPSAMSPSQKQEDKEAGEWGTQNSHLDSHLYVFHISFLTSAYQLASLQYLCLSPTGQAFITDSLHPILGNNKTLQHN